MDVEHLRARQDETELEVLDCHGVAGGFDDFLKIRVRDVLDFNRLHGVKRPALPGVRQTLTFLLLMEAVDNAPLSFRGACAGPRSTPVAAPPLGGWPRHCYSRGLTITAALPPPPAQERPSHPRVQAGERNDVPT